jgi:hypothetical protein
MGTKFDTVSKIDAAAGVLLYLVSGNLYNFLFLIVDHYREHFCHYCFVCMAYGLNSIHTFYQMGNSYLDRQDKTVRHQHYLLA